MSMGDLVIPPPPPDDPSPRFVCPLCHHSIPFDDVTVVGQTKFVCAACYYAASDDRSGDLPKTLRRQVAAAAGKVDETADTSTTYPHKGFSL